MFKQILILSCIALAAQAQVLCKWNADSSAATAAQFQCYRGETLELQPTLKQYGAVVSNYTATLYYQTNGMGSAWLQGTNGMFFTPAMDVGASSYSVYIQAAMSNGISYRANAIIRMLGSPGASPSTLPLPVQSIDFATTSYANAPWVLSSELSNSNNWNNAFGWGNHSGLYRPIDWLPSWSQVTDKPTEFTPSAHTQAWSTITNPPESISTALQVETDAIALNAITTNRTTQLWSVSGDSIIDGTGCVWSVTSGVTTNYGIWLYSVANSYGMIPMSTWQDIPTSEDSWSSEIDNGNAYLWYGKGGSSQCLWDINLSNFPSVPTPGGDMLEMTVNLEASTVIPSAPSGVAYLYRYVLLTQSTNRVESLVFSSELETQKELHRDSATNVIWRTVYSNGWSWLIAYTNYPAQ